MSKYVHISQSPCSLCRRVVGYKYDFLQSSPMRLKQSHHPSEKPDSMQHGFADTPSVLCSLAPLLVILENIS